jgi:formiminotetrahydrofolate cyclodeaminase
MLVDKTVRDLLDAFAAPTPTPGGGSAAALAGAVGASLLEMVAAMPKTKSNTPEERAALDAVLPELKSLRSSLTELVDRDAAAYDGVVAAYKLPKATDADKAARKTVIQAAMSLATNVPLQTARAAARLVALGQTVAANGNQNARSDAAVAIHLARTAVAGGLENVEVNLGSNDDDHARNVRSELESLRIEMSNFEL